MQPTDAARQPVLRHLWSPAVTIGNTPVNDPDPTTEEIAPTEAAPNDVAPATSDAAEPLPCPQCQAPRPATAEFCGDCGYIFAVDSGAAGPAGVPTGLIGGRFQLTEQIGERDGVQRFRARDVGNPEDPVPVIIVRQAASAPEDPASDSESKTRESSAFDFDLAEVAEQATEQMPLPPDRTRWPGVAWEQGVLLRAAHLSLPRLIYALAEDGFDYLIEEVPVGTPLWDAWDREGVTNRERFTWLMQLAEALDRLHFAGAIVEGLRPEMVIVSPTGIAILADLTDLLPLPLPGDVPLRGGFATAPELLLTPTEADERADMYSFGALMYSLLMGHELTDLDFTLTGMPRPFLERVPDANPFLARVLAKTFVREPAHRFPTDDGSITDPTGFRELIHALDACRQNLDRVRVDVAAWSTTGIARHGNEDAVAVYHTGEGRMEHADEGALIVLADGMGGMESGEVAAALTLQTVRQYLFAAPPFAASLPPTPPPDDSPAPTEAPDAATEAPEPKSPFPPLPPADVNSPDRTEDAHGERIVAALKEANRLVFETARTHAGARGMGCTAEVVLIDGPTAIIGHVGDSRVYRMRRSKLSQVTRDQTIVGRMVELGQLTEKEAETHPRRSELQQAIGGRPDVYPDIYSVTLEPGDWLLVCSDGLSNQISLAAMQAVFRESRNAERAARRLVNTALADGAMDNVSVAVVRVS
jgi:serine/threonine protein phosphatase PrpC